MLWRAQLGVSAFALHAQYIVYMFWCTVSSAVCRHIISRTTVFCCTVHRCTQSTAESFDTHKSVTATCDYH